MIRFENVTFTYDDTGVYGINLHIKRGEFVVLCGESGCGKTTLTRLINGLIPHYYEGKFSGKVYVDGKNVSEQPLYDTARQVGSVFQNPRSQFFNVDTTSEISFGCENLGISEEEIQERMNKTVQDFHAEKLIGRSIFHLSGGEKQKIACASVSAMRPDVFVLDEPSSNLDAASIAELRDILQFWKAQGKTIVVSEHRLFYLRGLADRFIYLKNGKIEQEYPAEDFEVLSGQERKRMGLRTICLGSLRMEERQWADRGKASAGRIESEDSKTLGLRNFTYAYKYQPEVLHIEDCELPAGGITAIIGDNGAGKSTFSRCFCGLEKNCGEVIWEGKRLKPKDRLQLCYMVMQEVNHQLFTESVLDEIKISMQQDDDELAERILEELDLLAVKDRHPMSLSGGQKQRVAIASAIAACRSILFFDEPTSGLDFRHMQEVADVLIKIQKAGSTVYVITHDLELILECCTDVIHFEHGKIIEQFEMDENGVQKIEMYFEASSTIDKIQVS